jgi:hypothetical protein
MMLGMLSASAQDEADMEIVTIATLLLPWSDHAISAEQSCAFELVRLAFFVLKLRKLEQGYALDPARIDTLGYNFCCNLLRHAIFQQFVRLTQLGARKHALQLIAARQ